LPNLRADLADAVLRGNWSGTGFASAGEVAGLADAALHDENLPPEKLTARGLPTDRTPLRALLNAISGGPTYSQARADGKLAGTEAGMTLFCADFVAKDWANGVGSGVPAKAVEAVEGFVPDSEAATPWGHCDDSKSESGRLWFGQNDSAFSFTDQKIST